MLLLLNMLIWLTASVATTTALVARLSRIAEPKALVSLVPKDTVHQLKDLRGGRLADLDG